jgi:hypothetical protein
MKKKRVFKYYKSYSYILILICKIGALEVFIKDSARSRQSTAVELGDIFGLSRMTMLRALHRLDYRNVKLTFKPGLTTPMRFKRLVFAIQHLKWTWQQWAAVIWTDETSIVLKSVRGKVRVWRKPDEKADVTVISRRWKHYSDLMLWGCYSCHQRGPCFIWFKELKEEKQ